MPMREWRDWRQVAETFVAERPCTDPGLVVEVLVLVLRHAHSWGDLVGATGWVTLASVEVYVNYVPGYRAARVLALLDRFTRWLHDRGDITAWQRDVMRSAIDVQRDANGLRMRGVPRVEELRYAFGAETMVDAFVESLTDRIQRDIAPSAVRVLVSYINRQLGESSEPPLGSIDVEDMIADVGPSGDHAAALFATLAAFYGWLAETDRLDATRSRAIAAGFASAALVNVSPAVA